MSLPSSTSSRVLPSGALSSPQPLASAWSLTLLQLFESPCHLVLPPSWELPQPAHAPPHLTSPSEHISVTQRPSCLYQLVRRAHAVLQPWTPWTVQGPPTQPWTPQAPLITTTTQPLLLLPSARLAQAAELPTLPATAAGNPPHPAAPQQERPTQLFVLLLPAAPPPTVLATPAAGLRVEVEVRVWRDVSWSQLRHKAAHIDVFTSGLMCAARLRGCGGPGEEEPAGLHAAYAVDHCWIITQDCRMYQSPMTRSPSGVITSSQGPDWEPGECVDVVVRVVCAATQQMYLLRAPDVSISAEIVFGHRFEFASQLLQLLLWLLLHLAVVQPALLLRQLAEKQLGSRHRRLYGHMAHMGQRCRRMCSGLSTQVMLCWSCVRRNAALVTGWSRVVGRTAGQALAHQPHAHED